MYLFISLTSSFGAIHIYLPLYYKSNAPNDPHRDLIVSMEEWGMRDDLNLYDKQSEHIYAEFECLK